MLSRITEPTSGRAVLRGRMASLLEVGTGFHPDLSGRENIFLNGAILGMKRAEIAKRFDEIVDFAEIGQFIETPVKRYSSGMYTRLAFAIAAHLESEILLVDEVLAVGDAGFQKKCMGKMKGVAQRRPHRPFREPQSRGDGAALRALPLPLRRRHAARSGLRARSWPSTRGSLPAAGIRTSTPRVWAATGAWCCTPGK